MKEVEGLPPSVLNNLRATYTMRKSWQGVGNVVITMGGVNHQVF
jgi:hypothetical protein